MVDLFDYDTEEAVLGALLVDTNAISLVANRLKVSDFYRDKHKWIYEACLTLHNHNDIVEQYTVTHELARAERLTPIGGASELSFIIAKCPSSVFIESHAEILIKLGARRSLSTAGYLISKLSEIDDVDKAYGDALGILISIKSESKDDILMSPKDQAEFAEKRYAEKNQAEGKSLIPFGFSFLDRMGGMDKGDVVVIAGPPGEGKTTLAHQIGLHVSSVRSEVLFVSLEMSRGQITDRDMSRITGVPLVVIRRGIYKEGVYDKIYKATGVMSEGKMFYYFPSWGTSQQIYSVARRIQAQCDLSLIVVDYIQLMNDTDGSRNENERLTNISRAIKIMAHNLNIPIIAVSRINRTQGVSNLDRTYGSGSLSYDPDWSFLLEREKDVDNKYTNFCNLITTKVRQGGIKDAGQRLIYNEEKKRFYEVVEDTYPKTGE
jgi:replicative DNA helicase